MSKRPFICISSIGRIGKRLELLFLLVLLLVGAACVPERAVVPNGGAQLVQDVTLAATVAVATRILSPTPSPIVIPVSTSELISPLQVVTVESSFVLVTPTLPPSKTPTVTPTQTLTRTPTPRPTLIPPTSVVSTPIPIPPLNGVVPLPTAVVVNPAGQSCPTPWFFTQVTVGNCPPNPPAVSPGSFEQFQNGFMLWVGQQDAIYVLYDSANFPRWQVLNDAFEDGMPDIDPAYNNPPPYTWQPRRGFGLLWRSNSSVRDRIGWAVTEYETPYTIQVQIAADGTIYMSEPRGGVFSLTFDGSEWKRYDG